jgi:hypothetical protein
MRQAVDFVDAVSGGSFDCYQPLRSALYYSATDSGYSCLSLLYSITFSRVLAPSSGGTLS